MKHKINAMIEKHNFAKMKFAKFNFANQDFYTNQDFSG